MATLQKITPCLWFDDEAEAAVSHYLAIFGGSRIVRQSRYDKGRHKPEGTVLTIIFDLMGQQFMALNGGPNFKFTAAVSMSVSCDSQAEIDYYWERLSEGGAPIQCGWLKDKFGLSWQIVPSSLGEMLEDAPSARASRVMNALMGMVKLDFEALQRAYDGWGSPGA